PRSADRGPGDDRGEAGPLRVVEQQDSIALEPSADRLERRPGAGGGHGFDGRGSRPRFPCFPQSPAIACATSRQLSMTSAWTSAPQTTRPRAARLGGSWICPVDALWPRWIWLRALGLIFLPVFHSLAFQITGLIGPRGILPAGDYLAQVHRA